MANRRIGLLALLVVGMFSSMSWSATMEDVENSFYPYKNGFPTVAGFKPGMTITKDNVDSVKDALTAIDYQLVKLGWTDIRTTEGVVFDLPLPYVEATKKNLNKVSLGGKVGELNGWTAGRPFPEEPSLSDPRAGEKIAWNYKYGLNWGDQASICPFYWRLHNMNTDTVEREFKHCFHFLNFIGRTTYAPIPEVPENPSRVFRGIYLRVMEPYDVKNTQLLILRYENDLQRDDAWLYLGFQRRVRRLATGQTTDAFLGTDIMIEDFEGFNGRISDYKWEYKGTTVALGPWYKHNDLELATDIPAEADGFKYIDLWGKGHCFPKITWMLRKFYILEGRPVDPNHPIGMRRMWVSAASYNISREMVYDRKGDLWKSFQIGKAHPDYYHPMDKGTNIPIDDSFHQIDLQALHCTTGQFKGLIDPKDNPPELFTVQNMRVTGQ